MEIYNENMEKIENPDLSLGYLEPSIRMEHHEAVEGIQEKWHYEVVKEYPNGGKEVEKIIDVPGITAQAAWDEEIPIQIYVLYTQEKLDRMEEERNKLTMEDRLAALEEKLLIAEILLGVNA